MFWVEFLLTSTSTFIFPESITYNTRSTKTHPLKSYRYFQLQTFSNLLNLAKHSNLYIRLGIFTLLILQIVKRSVKSTDFILEYTFYWSGTKRSHNEFTEPLEERVVKYRDLVDEILARGWHSISIVIEDG